MMMGNNFTGIVTLKELHRRRKECFAAANKAKTAIRSRTVLLTDWFSLDVVVKELLHGGGCLVELWNGIRKFMKS